MNFARTVGYRNAHIRQSMLRFRYLVSHKIPSIIYDFLVEAKIPAAPNILFASAVLLDVLCGDGFVGQDNEAFDHISQLSNIATPTLLRQHLNRLIFNAFCRYVVLSANALQKVFYEDCYIAFSLAQRCTFIKITPMR